jgi:hypothetical protein
VRRARDFSHLFAAGHAAEKLRFPHIDAARVRGILLFQVDRGHELQPGSDAVHRMVEAVLPILGDVGLRICQAHGHPRSAPMNRGGGMVGGKNERALLVPLVPASLALIMIESLCGFLAVSTRKPEPLGHRLETRLIVILDTHHAVTLGSAKVKLLGLTR